MKKLFVILTALAFVVGFSGVSFAGIKGTDHDFSGETWNTSGEICVVCHTPHNADATVTGAPLWDHEVTATAAFTLYTSSTLDATLGQPGGVSLLCLSCHDGTVAIDSFGGATGTNFVTGDANLGTDLREDHPISFVYDNALFLLDDELYDPIVANSGLGGTIDADMLFSTKLECASCHDPHSDVFSSFLVKDNAESGLCLTCHNK